MVAYLWRSIKDNAALAEPKYTEDTNTAADPKNTEPEERCVAGHNFR